MKALRSGSFAFALGVLACAAGTPEASANPFGQFTGSWSGNGTITVQDGTRERIRCRGQYRSSEGGNALKLELRCASDSYKFELQSDIAYDGGNVSGSWNETTRNVFGSLSGRASANAIQATASSVGFTAQLSLTTKGNQQRVSIRSPGSEISEVAISLARSGR
ncbi:MAG: hypothetical protein FJX62_16580 [Alphaproteobacteria bacterium]|nr:hypothetical protein [Alphaproteobacteria bacterium]